MAINKDTLKRFLTGRALFVIILVVVVLLSSWYVYYSQLLRSRANLLCPLPASPEQVHGQVFLNPTNSDSIFDCSSQDVIIASDGDVVVGRYVNADGSVTGDYGAEILFRNLTIAPGGQLQANGQGYQAGETDGAIGNAGPSTDNVGGSGGGYGGAGGEGRNNGLTLPGNPGQPFGDATAPILLGGAGGDNGSMHTGGNGGGAIKVTVSGTLTIGGTVSANGNTGSLTTDNVASGGGGAGGSVLINAGSFAGNGTVQALGGSTEDALYRGGGGGGGRIFMQCLSSNNFQGAVSAAAGLGSQQGQIGTILGPGCKPQQPLVTKVFDGNREVPQSGGLTKNTTLTFATDLQTVDSQGTLRLQIELRSKDEDFTGVANFTETNYKSSPQLCANPAGDCGTITVSGLATGTEYKWRARAISNTGLASNWTDVVGNADHVNFIVTGAAANLLLLTGDDQSAAVGQNLGNPIGARLVDASGFGIPFENVVWSITAGGGSVPSSNVQTDANGEVYSNWQMGTAAGANTVVLSKSGLGSTLTFHATATAGDVANYRITAPSLVQTHTSFTLTINAVDQYNNPVAANNLLTLQAKLSDGVTAANGVLAPATVQLVDGTATITTATYDTQEVVKIKAYDPVLSPSISGLSYAILFVNNIGNCPAIDVDQDQEWKAMDAPGGVFDCRGLGTLTVRSGVTLTLTSNDNGDSNWTNDYGVTILADNMVIENNAVVSADGKGYLETHGPSYGGSSGDAYGGYSAEGLPPIGDVYEPLLMGSGGVTNYGYPGSGGGAIKLTVGGTFTNNGTLTAGALYSGSAGGGTGGSIWIDTTAFNGDGTIAANGSGRFANWNTRVEGGSGGRIALYYNNGNFPVSNMDHVQSRGYSGAGPGTVYVEHKGVSIPKGADLYVDNNGSSGQPAGLIAGSYNFSSINLTRYGHLKVLGQDSLLTINSGAALNGDSTKPSLSVEGTINYTSPDRLYINGVDLTVSGRLMGVADFTLGNNIAGGMTLYAHTWYYDQSHLHSFNSIEVGAQGVLSLVSYDNGDSNYTNDYKLELHANDVIVDNGGRMTADGLGYGEQRGPGWGGGAGDAYGGYSAGGVAPIGDVYEPVLLGSGGVGTYGAVGPGGGAIKLVVSGTLTDDGSISANALYSGNSGGGTGGSIWLSAGTINGSGTIATNGSGRFDNWATNVSGGSGGRIAIYYTDGNFPVTNMDQVQSRGYSGAGPGTIYIEQNGVDIPKGAHLYVDNAGSNAQPAGLVEGTYQFADIHQTRYGHLRVLGQNGILEITAGAALNGDTSKPSLSVEGTIDYTGTERLFINGIDLTVAGRLMGVTDFTLGNSLNGGMTLFAHTWYYNQSNLHTYGNIQIGALGTLTLVSYNSGTGAANDYGVELRATDLNIASGGSVTANGKGYGEGQGPGYGGGAGSAYGGYSQGGVAPMGDVYEPVMLGSGGVGTYGWQGQGGGAIKLDISGTLTVDGVLTASALYGGGNAGGGTGGSLWLDVNAVAGSGTIAANGSARFDNWANNVGGGSGGRIAIYYNSAAFPITNMDNVQSRAWSGAGPGTIYLEQKTVDTHKGAHLYVDNAGNGGTAGLVEGIYQFADIHQSRSGSLRVLGQNSILEITAGAALNGDTSKPSLAVEGTIDYTGTERLFINGIDLTVLGRLQGVTDFTLANTLTGGITLYAHTWYYDQTHLHSYGDINIGANGTLTLVSYDAGSSDYSGDYGVELQATNITIASGGSITADGKGYAERRGPGYGGGAGDGYGGYSQGGVAPMGDVYEPVMLGSGGIGTYGWQGQGGGAIKLDISGTLTNNGTLTASALYGGNCAAGGTGGSLWLNVATLNGTGTITANGSAHFGNLADNVGGGSGGRIAIYYTNGNFPVTNMDNVQTRAWSGAGPGTIYIEQNGVDAHKAAHLYVDNAGSGGTAGLIEGTYQFADIHQTRSGNLKVLGQNSVLEITAGAALNGDSSKPALSVDGTINYTGTNRLYINGIDLTVSGRIMGVTDFTLGDAMAGGMTLFAHTWYYNQANLNSFGDIQVGTNGALTLVSYDSGGSDYTNDYGVELRATNLTIASGGVVTADGKGYAESRGPGYGGGAGGGYGGYSQGGVAPRGDMYQPTMLGSGGRGTYGWEGKGGGAIKLDITGTLTNNGVLSANALFGGGNAGGSTGGSIWLDVSTLNGNGVITANGSARFDNWAENVSAGSGGRIAIYYNGGTFPVSDYDHVQAHAWSSAGPGTVYIENKSSEAARAGSLYIRGNSGRGMDFTAGTWIFDNVDIGSGVDIWLRGDTDNNIGVTFVLNGSFNLGSGARIMGAGLGYASASGPGKGVDGVLQNGGGGAAHGGNGGNGESSDGSTQTAGGTKYGDQLFPTTLGSGGGLGATGAAGGAGGGAFAVYAKTSNVNIAGNIDMDGTTGLTGSPGGGGGAGGAILIDADSCNISGTLTARGGDGGDSTFDGGGGGGGRISLIRENGVCGITGSTISVANGNSAGGQIGQPGTYFGVVTIPHIDLVKQTTTTDVIIPVGGVTSEDQVKLSADISDTGASNGNSYDLVADFEIIEANQTFPQQVLGLSEVSSNMVTYTSGSPIPVTVYGPASLVPGEAYKWRARVRNITSGIAGDWVGYGNNGEAADFVVSSMTGFDVTPAQTTVNAGSPVNVSIRAIDIASHTITGYSGTSVFSTAPTVNPAPALPTNYTFGPSDNGTHTFNGELVFFVPGTYTVTVTDSINPGLSGTSVPITVNAVATPTPTASTTTSATLTPTDNTVNGSATPTATVTLTPQSCSEDPNQAFCQVDVIISNIKVTVDQTGLTSRICWDTNIPTIGQVTYGETLLSNATAMEVTYATSHCTTLTGLQADTGYNFKISANSEVGRNAIAKAFFIVGNGTVPPNPESCIAVSNYSFNAAAQLLLNYQTAYTATCNVSYSYLGTTANLFRDIESTSMIYHLSKLNLAGLDNNKDLAYTISCRLDDSAAVTAAAQTCSLSGSVPQGKLMIYLPVTGEENTISGTVTKIINAIAQILPVLTIPLLLGLVPTIAVQYPQGFYYAIFWLRRKRKKQAWGLVYDGADRKPVPFAVVRLYNAASEQLLQEEVTNIDGKYNFLVGTGNYRLVAEQSSYYALQKTITISATSSEIAEELALSKRAAVQPISPQSFWSRLKLFFYKNNEYMVLCGFLISLVASILSPIWYNFLVLGLYFIQEVILLWQKGLRWGRVVDTFGKPMPGVFVRLFDPEQQRQLEVTLTDVQGRYKFLTADGHYMATAYQEGYELSSPAPDVANVSQKFVWIDIKNGVTKNDITLKATA